jgi:hypothetical protein
MGKAVDSIIAYRILKLLVTPFNQTEAFKLGIIDAKGNELMHMRDFTTTEQRDAYTLLHRLVFRIKKIIEKVPVDNKKILSLAAAYALIKEQYDIGKEPIDLEVKYINILEQNLSDEVTLVENFLSESRRITFRQFMEDGGGGGGKNVSAFGDGGEGEGSEPEETFAGGVQSEAAHGGVWADDQLREAIPEGEVSGGGVTGEKQKRQEREVRLQSGEH